MVEATEEIGFPCPYMVFDPNGYHSCSVLTVEFIHSDSDGSKIDPVMCVLCQDYSLSDSIDRARLAWEVARAWNREFSREER